jgi:hypothetical protein
VIVTESSTPTGRAAGKLILKIFTLPVEGNEEVSATPLLVTLVDVAKADFRKSNVIVDTPETRGTKYVVTLPEMFLAALGSIVQSAR